jgi:hypothetical protein
MFDKKRKKSAYYDEDRVKQPKRNVHREQNKLQKLKRIDTSHLEDLDEEMDW